MYELVSGTIDSRSDTASFVALLNELPAHLPSAGEEFFQPGRDVIVTRAPGRLDLMGGIADYSGALVLQLPIAAATHVALQLDERAALTIVSLAADGHGAPRRYELSLADFTRAGEPIAYAAARTLFGAGDHWATYVAGVFLVLMRERGQRFTTGARILIRSEVPEGKGVSSSAALEVAVMRAVASAYGIELAPREMAFLCQRVENLVAGAPCGVMDQMTAVCGEAERLLALLCQPGEVQGTLPLPRELSVWGIDSGIRHSVGGTAYSTVRTAAFMGYRIMADLAGLPCRATARAGLVEIDDAQWHGYLANSTPAEFERSYAHHLPAQMSGAEFLARYGGITDPVTTIAPEHSYPVRAATAHPIYEHARVTEFATLLQHWRGDEGARLGALMYEAHASYGACGLGTTGTDELVNLVRAAGPAHGLYGAKITGGGSGGTVAVLGRREAAATVAAIAAEYAQHTGRAALVIGGSSDGAWRFGRLTLTGINIRCEETT